MQNTKSVQAPKTNGTATAEILPSTPQGLKVLKSDDIDDRLHRLNLLFDLQDKYNKVRKTKLKLQEFETAQSKEESELVISDDNGREFKTTNSAVIAEVQKLILKVTTEKEAELADKLVF